MGTASVMWLSLVCAGEAQASERPARPLTVQSQHERSVRGGRSNASALMQLIQNTVAPDSWSLAAGAGQFGAGSPATGGAGSRSLRLIELIQETIDPDSWDINGGKGTIQTFP